MAKLSLLTTPEKSKALKPLAEGIKKAKELKELAAILTLIKPSLAREEFTLIANAVYEACTSSKAAEQESEEEGGDREISIDEPFDAIVAHLKNIQVQTLIEKEQSGSIQLQALQMAIVIDELRDKILEYQLALATKTSKVDAEQMRTKSFTEDNQELQQRL